MYNSTMMSDRNQDMEPLYDRLTAISNLMETTFSIELHDKDFKEGREEILHMYLQQACRAAIVHCLPWVFDSQENEHRAVVEIMVYLSEREIGSTLGLSVHNDQSFLEVLKGKSIFLTQEVFAQGNAIWQTYFWPKRDLEGMAVYLLTLVRHGRVIYHILPQEDWKIALKNGIYTPISLELEGFIHCSEVDQVLDSAQAYFMGQCDLLLLCIALNQVLSEVRYEGASTGIAQGFPHIYGPLNLDAVVNVSDLITDVHGNFILPRYPQALAVWEGAV